MAVKENERPDMEQHDEHGSVGSYVIGFILSLIFTIIPYYMVTREITTGSTLVLTILGFAIVQMFVQIFFFLHLGRGPKPLYNVVFFFATAAMITMVVGASLLIMDNLYRNMSPQEVILRLAQDENIAEINGHPTGACQGNNANHSITINGNEVSPAQITAKRCDTLTFSMSDGTDRVIAFGTRDTPRSYGGMDTITVRGSRSKIITLNETGTFEFYDQSNDSLGGTFTVTP